MRKRGINNAITGEAYEIYRELCGRLDVEALTQRRVSGLINELDINGVLNSKVVSLGRYGRTKKIRLALATSVIHDVYSDDPWMNQLLTYRFKQLLRKK